MRTLIRGHARAALTIGNRGDRPRNHRNSRVLDDVETSPQPPARIGRDGYQVSLLVADNRGGRPSRAAGHRLWRNATALARKENRGSGPATGQAVRIATGDTLLALSPDTRAEGEPFSASARAFADLGVVAVAPRLVEIDGSAAREGRLRLAAPGRENQATFQRPHFPDACDSLLLYRLALNDRRRRRFRYGGQDRCHAFSVEQAAAAALAARLPARLAYRGLLTVGMLLRLTRLPFRRAMSRSWADAARSFVAVLGVALTPTPHNGRHPALAP